MRSEMRDWHRTGRMPKGLVKAVAEHRADEKPRFHTGGTSRLTRPGLTPGTPPSDIPPRPQEARFTDYLASSFQVHRPLRNERQIQRNRALVAIIIVIVVMAWLLGRWL